MSVCQSYEEEEKQIFLQLSVIFHLDSIVLTAMPVGRKKVKFHGKAKLHAFLRFRLKFHRKEDRNFLVLF